MGSDYASFVCYGAPSFSLRSLNWSYSPYTWHTNRDTFDKVIFADLKHNATLYAMLAYMASEEEDRLPRDRRTGFPRTRIRVRQGHGRSASQRGAAGQSAGSSPDSMNHRKVQA